jgi:hypothetical protein
MGHVVDEGAMACAWMHSAGVRQMVGYTVPTWYGYGGWGLHKYFTRLPGALSFAEAFFANTQSLLHQLASDGAQRLPGLEQEDDGLDGVTNTAKVCERLYRKCFDTSATVGEIPRARLGLLYDSDHIVLYGDPAWHARLSAGPLPYTVTFSQMERTEESLTWLVTVHVHQDGSWDSPTPDDKSCSPGRPPFALLPSRVRSANVLHGAAIATRLFVLFNVQGPCIAGQTLAASVQARL